MFAIGTFTGALFWAAVPIFLFPDDNFLPQALISFVLAGLCGGLVVANAGRLESQIPFILTVSTALVGRFLYEGGHDYTVMAILWIAFTVYLLIASYRTHQTITGSLRLRFENSRVIKALQSSNAQAQDLNTRLNNKISELELAEERIMASLNEKEVLLKEIHHRVKNNLQVMSSLLALQSGYYNDEKVVEACKNSERRVWSMALVHETLYRSDDLAHIDANQYLVKLLEDLMAAYAVDPARVSLLKEIEPLPMKVDSAVDCGLIVNELVSNCLKHAFPDGRDGEIELSLRLIGLDEIELAVKDNGVGLPAGVESGNSRSFGLDLVDMLVDELNGTIEIEREGGTEFRITFKQEDEANGI
jgi:two-component sensor histidine kinase